MKNKNLQKLLLKTCLTLITVFIINMPTANCQTIADTFDAAEIPTNLGSYSPSCNGPLTKLSITLPAGGPWTVNSIDISYNMTAQAGGLKSQQRSYIRCQNSTTSESAVFEGTGNGGVQVYNRAGVSIANGSYSGNTILNFEMRAWRTLNGAGCNTTYNRVDNFSWIINVHYSMVPNEGSVGIGTTTPQSSAILDLNSTTQAFLPPRMTTAQRDAIASPVAGMMIFNTSNQKLEIYTSGWGSIYFSTPGVKKLLGGSLFESFKCVQQTDDGGYILFGNSSSSNTGTLTGITGNGGHDLWVIKMDNAGNTVWQKLYGGSGVDISKHIEQTSDGGYIMIGYTNSTNSGTLTGITNYGGNDYWILKLDANGNVVWQKLLGGTLDEFAQMIHPVDGGYIVAGYSSSSNTGTLTGLTTNGGSDYWILKLDNSGNVIWQKLYGGSLADALRYTEPTQDGGFIVTGGSSSSNTGTLTGLTNNGQSDSWILKLNSSGDIVWQKLLGGNSTDDAYSAQETIDGGFIVSGYAYSSNTGTLTGVTGNGLADAWTLKLDDSGNTIWQRLLGGTDIDWAQSVRQTSEGGFIVAGYAYSTNTGTLLGINSNGVQDYYVFKLDNTGVIVWQKLLGGSQNDYGFFVEPTTDGGFLITGYSGSSNTGTLLGLISNGPDDAWVFKMDANGNAY